MPKIHLIGGQKGGVGKSFFTRVLLEYCRREEKPIDLTFVDADLTNPDVGLIYEPEKYQLFLENDLPNSNGKNQQIDSRQNSSPADFLHEIFYKGLSKTVLVNLPPQVDFLIDDWLKRFDILTLAKEQGITFVYWFLCTGEFHSTRLFKESVNKYKGQISHVLVRNNGLCSDWRLLLEDVELANAISQYQIKVIDFPALYHKERNLIDLNKWTFATALNQESLGMIGQQRIKLFLNQAYTEIEKSEEIVVKIQTKSLLANLRQQAAFLKDRFLRLVAGLARGENAPKKIFPTRSNKFHSSN